MTAPKITIEKDPSTWCVSANGTKLGVSRNVLRMTEGTYPPVLYVPQADLDMALFAATDKSTHCPHKGDASYFTVSGLENTGDVHLSFKQPANEFWPVHITKPAEIGAVL